MGLSALPLPRIALSSTGDAIFLYGIGLLAGLGLIYTGFLNFRRRRLISDTPTSVIDSLAMGPVEVKGTVEAAAGTIDAPFGGECVISSYTIESPDPDDPGWNTVESDLQAKPFYIDDGSGKVLVNAYDIDDMALDLEFDGSDHEIRRVINHDGSGEDMPEELVTFRQSIGREGTPDAFIGSKKRRYTQETLRPGDTVFAFGEATFPDSDTVGTTPNGSVEVPEADAANTQLQELAGHEAVEAILCDGDGSPIFFISNQEESTLIEERRWSLAWKLPVGALLTSASFILLLSELGFL